MWIADNWKDYTVIDTSSGEKLEKWGKYTLVRPDPQVIWHTEKKNPLWNRADASYKRSSTGGGAWSNNRLPESWTINYRDLTFLIKPMGFKHTGLFPEQAANWDWFSNLIKNSGREIKVLNLFAYTGGATVAAAKAGASVVHVDAAKGMVAQAKENARLSGLADAPIRYIVDDCKKFIEREIRRGNKYDGIIMDPPSYGRGNTWYARARFIFLIRRNTVRFIPKRSLLHCALFVTNTECDFFLTEQDLVTAWHPMGVI